ncbi:MAG TPA: hypothetical protein VFN59_00215 [Acidimicrobiales bacterium]|nr:hypothetical protein [Acidimicrobiales bacterium]
MSLTRLDGPASAPRVESPAPRATAEAPGPVEARAGRAALTHSL